MTCAKLLVLALVAIANLQEAYGHGMMMDPVNRSSAWRKGFNVEPNYTDNEHFCGGYTAHHIINKGKCGECGDNYSLPRPRVNENGGLYGTGVIVKKYEAGSVVNVTVHIAANHMGHFEFSLCPLNGTKELETEECFDQHRLPMADGSGYKWPLRIRENKDYIISMVLPKDVTCEQCVFRWHYRTGNTWGICDSGKGAMGCGPQEVFRSCADVSIVKPGSLAAAVPEVPADVPKNL